MLTTGGPVLVRGAIVLSVRGCMKPVRPTAIRAEGTGSFMIASPNCGWPHTAKGRFEATIRPSTGEVVLKGFATN